MAEYRVEIVYATRRHTVECTSIIEAENERMAELIGRKKWLHGYPARHCVSVFVQPAPQPAAAHS